MHPKRWSVISGMSGRIRPEYAENKKSPLYKGFNKKIPLLLEA